MANLLTVLAAAAEHAAEDGAAHAGPVAFGFIGPVGWVALAMTTLILIAIYFKAPRMLASGLDASIAEIKNQLAEAKALRAEAEVLRKEYADKIANAEKDALAMLEHARREAEAIVSKAEADTTAVIVRREKMAEEKIAAAERGAVADLRNKTAEAAAIAARGIIAEKHTAQADKALVDGAISAL